MKRESILKVACAVILAGILGVALHAQRSTATQLQFEPSTGLFHLMANSVDYRVQNGIIENCGTLVACAITIPSSPITVYGTAAASSATTVTLTGLPFTSTTSYVCTATDQTTAANAVFKMANASASSSVITDSNSNSDTFSYICVGT